MIKALSKMVMLVMLVLSLLTVGGCCTQPKAGSGNRQNNPWIELFNGCDLTGWTVKCHEKDAHKTFFKVTEGTIIADSMHSKDHDYVWLMTNREYDNFILKFDFQVSKQSQGNSGIQIRSRYDDQNAWLDGPQIDIHPKQPWRTGMMWDETRGNKRWIDPDLPIKKWVDKSMAAEGLKFYYSEDTDQWNQMVITAVGTDVTATLNGIQITDFDGQGVLDDDQHQKYHVGMNGHIALQIHRKNRLKIQFKNILIKDLP